MSNWSDPVVVEFSSESTNTLSDGEIAAIVVAVIIAVLAIGVVIVCVFLCRNHRRKRKLLSSIQVHNIMTNLLIVSVTLLSSHKHMYIHTLRMILENYH